MKAISEARVRATKKAVLYFDRQTLAGVKHLVRRVSTEVQWFHRIRRIEKEDLIIFYIFDMYIPPQEVSATSVDSNPAQYAALIDEVEEECRDPETGEISDDEMNVILNSLSVWCHSHVNMGPSPSGTDEGYFKERLDAVERMEDPGPQVMLIFNKRNEYYARIVDVETNIVYENSPIYVHDTETDMTYIEHAIKNKIETRSYTNRPNGTSQWPRSQGTGQGNPQAQSTRPVQTPTSTGQATTRPGAAQTTPTATGTDSSLTDLQSSQTKTDTKWMRPEGEIVYSRDKLEALRPHCTVINTSNKCEDACLKVYDILRDLIPEREFYYLYILLYQKPSRWFEVDSSIPEEIKDSTILAVFLEELQNNGADAEDLCLAVDIVMELGWDLGPERTAVNLKEWANWNNKKEATEKPQLPAVIPAIPDDTADSGVAEVEV